MRFRIISTARETLEIMQAPGFSFTDEAIFHQPVNINGRLSPLRDASFSFEKGGVHINAKSDGQSILLLPHRYSRCLKAPDEVLAAGNIQILRTNLIHTAIIFEGTLDLRLDYRFNVFGDLECGNLDKQDLTSLRIFEDLGFIGWRRQSFPGN